MTQALPTPETLEGAKLTITVVGRLWAGPLGHTVYTFEVHPTNETSIWRSGGIPANVLLADPMTAIADFLTSHSGDFESVDAWQVHVYWNEPCSFADGSEGFGRRRLSWETPDFDEYFAEACTEECE